MVNSILLPVLVPSLLFSVGTGAILPVLVLGALELGATPGQATFIVALRGLVSLLLTVPAGQFIDRIGDRAAMVASTTAAVGVFALIVGALMAESGPTGLALYTVGLMALAPIENTWGLARQALVAETVSAQDVGRALTLLGGTMRVGRLIGPMITAGLLILLPLWSAFLAAAVSALAAVGVLFLPGAVNFGKDRAGGRRQANEPRIKVRELDVRWTAVALAGVSVSILAVLRALNPIVVPLVGVDVGLHESTIAVLIAIGAAVEIALIVPGGYVKDRLGRVFTMATCLGIFAGGFALLAFGEAFLSVLVAVVVMGIGNGLGSGVNMTIGADLSPARGRPTFLGVWAIFNNTGSFAGPLLASAVIAAAGLGATAAATAGLGVFGALWMIAWKKKLGLPGVR